VLGRNKWRRTGLQSELPRDRPDEDPSPESADQLNQQGRDDEGREQVTDGHRP
jgi:hypothetical protein